MTSFDYRLNPIYTIKECSSYGALYTTDYCCSNRSLVDKIICDLNKAPDSPHLHTFSSNQRHCFHCKDVLGDGELCQRCTCMRCGSGLTKGLCLIFGNNQNSLNDSPSISENSSQSPPHINPHCCYECGDPLDVPVINNPKPCKNQTIDELPQTLPSSHPTCYSGDKSPFTCDSTPNYVDECPNVFNPPPQPLVYSCEFCRNDACYGHYCTPQVPLIYLEPCYTQDFDFSQDFHDFQQQYLCFVKISGFLMKLTNILVFYDDDDDEDYTIVITPKEPDNSLSMRDEHLDTIPTTESDKFMKSSVEDLVPNPSEFEGEHECDVPDISKKIYSNPLFDEEIISIKIDPHHFNAESDLIESMLNQDSLIISFSSKIDYLLDEFAGELILLKSIPPGIDKADCDTKEEIRLIEKLLYDNSSPRPPKEFNSDNFDAIIESFSPSPIPVEDSDPFIEEIDLFFASDGSIPSGIDIAYSDSEGDNLFLERLLHDDPIPLLDILDFSNVI
nr:hypothetical protein [Tanacetum cinerariifolium]